MGKSLFPKKCVDCDYRGLDVGSGKTYPDENLCTSCLVIRITNRMKDENNST